MTQEEQDGYIEKVGEQYLLSVGEDPSLMYSGDVRAVGAAFIAGRNKVLDEAIEALGKCVDQEQRKGYSLSEYAFKDAIFILESLKVDL